MAAWRQPQSSTFSPPCFADVGRSHRRQPPQENKPPWPPPLRTTRLDLYLHNYLTKKNMHTTAEIFAREANFYPKGVAIEHPEGFLSEWWSIFWSMFSNKFPEHTVQDNGSGPSNSNPAMPSPNFNYMLQNMCPTMPPGFPNVAGPSIMQMQQIKNLFESDYSRTMMPRPDNGNLLGSDFLGMMMPRPENGNLLECDLPRMMMPRPENGNLLGHDFSRAMMLRPETGNLLESDMSRTMMPRPPRPENGNFPRSDIPAMNSNSPFMNVDQLARMLPSSSNPSYQREKVFKNPQLCLTRDDKCGSSFRRPTAAGPSKPSTKPHELKFKSPETDTRSPAKNLNFNSQLNDPLVRLVPSSINFSPPPQEKVHKKPHQLCLKTDDKSSTRFCSSAAEETARFLPKASPGKMEHAADARRVCEPERFALLSVDRSTQMLPSGSNFSGPKKNKKQRQLAAIGCKRYGAGLKRSTAAEPAPLALRAILPKIEPADDTDTRAFVQAHIGPPPGMELDSNSQPNDIDQLPLLLSSPSKHSPQQNVSKNGKLPVTQDDGCDTNLKSSTDSEPTHPAPEATIPPKTELAETGMELRNRISREESSIRAGYIDSLLMMCRKLKGQICRLIDHSSRFVWLLPQFGHGLNDVSIQMLFILLENTAVVGRNHEYNLISTKCKTNSSFFEFCTEKPTIKMSHNCGPGVVKGIVAAELLPESILNASHFKNNPNGPTSNDICTWGSWSKHHPCRPIVSIRPAHNHQ